MKYCPKCGNPFTEGTKICPKCGNPLPQIPAAPAAPQAPSAPAHPWRRKEQQKSNLFGILIAAGIVLIAAIVFAVLVGTHVICLSHDYAEATCTEPATCRKCGRTKGEALGHEWIDATCTEPRTCSRCGETDGLPLGHEWADATCTEPKTCTDCGATEGEPLGHDYVDGVCTRCGAELRSSGFADSGYSAYDVSVNGSPVSFTYMCGLTDGSADSPTTVTAQAENASGINVSDFGISPIDGYSLYKLSIRIDYDEGYDRTAYYVTGALLDYYDPALSADTAESLDNFTLNDDTVWPYTYELENEGVSETAYVFAYAETFDSYRVLYRYVYIPTGYDGFMIGMYDYFNLGQSVDADDYFYDIADEDSVFIRLVP